MLDFTTKVGMVERQFRAGMFDQARSLLSVANPHRSDSAFAVLTLTTAYFEAINEFRTGQDSTDKSRAFFRAGFRNVFPAMVKDVLGQGHSHDVVDLIIDSVYFEIRCGLFHNAYARSHVRPVWGQPNALTIDYRGGQIDAINVGPERFTECVENDFNDYIGKLKASMPGDQIRDRFEKAFDLRSGAIPRAKHGHGGKSGPTFKVSHTMTTKTS